MCMCVCARVYTVFYALAVHQAANTLFDDETTFLELLCMQGRAPPTDDIMRLRNTLLQSSDLRRVSDLEKQLKQGSMSDDASKALVSLLQVNGAVRICSGCRVQGLGCNPKVYQSRHVADAG